jgi:hypothetical protein
MDTFMIQAPAYTPQRPPRYTHPPKYNATPDEDITIYNQIVIQADNKSILFHVTDKNCISHTTFSDISSLCNNTRMYKSTTNDIIGQTMFDGTSFYISTRPINTIGTHTYPLLCSLYKSRLIVGITLENVDEYRVYGIIDTNSEHSFSPYNTNEFKIGQLTFHQSLRVHDNPYIILGMDFLKEHVTYIDLIYNTLYLRNGVTLWLHQV